MPLEVRAQRDGATLHVALVGDLDAHTAPMVAEVVDPLLAAEDLTAVVVDAHELSFMDSVGITEFLKIHRVVAERGGFVRLAGAGPTVRRVLDITGLSELLDIR